jgi:hypothetical protein
VLTADIKRRATDGRFEQQVSLAHLPDGCYFVRVEPCGVQSPVPQVLKIVKR